MKVYAFILGVKSGKFQGNKVGRRSSLARVYPLVIYLASVELLICFQVTRASHQISIGSTLFLCAIKVIYETSMNCYNHPTEPAVVQCRRLGEVSAGIVQRL